MIYAPLFILGLVAAAGPLGLQASQDDGVRVVVMPLRSTQLDPEFGERAAREVRARIHEFPRYTVVSEAELERALGRYEVARGSLDAINSRQLAHLIGAQVVFWGVVKRTDPGYTIESRFIDVRTGDQDLVPPVRIDGGGRTDIERFAGVVIEALEGAAGKLTYRAVCADDVAQGRPRRALESCDRALSLDPTHLDALYNAAAAAWVIYGETGHEGWADSAMTYFEWALDRGRRCSLDNIDIAANTTPLCQDRLLPHDPDLITSLYSEYLARNPEEVAVRLKVASDLRRIEALPKAIEVLEAGRALTPDNTALLLALGEYALRLTQASDTIYARMALEAFRAVLAIDPENWAARRGTRIVETFFLRPETKHH